MFQDILSPSTWSKSYLTSRKSVLLRSSPLWAPASMKNPPEQRIFRNLRRKATLLHIVASHLFAMVPDSRINSWESWFIFNL
jgi:hypothetical protein